MFEIDIAKRHISSNRRGTAFVLMAVAIAVGVIVMSLALTSGTRLQIIENTVEKNPHVTVGPKEGEAYIHLYRTLSGDLEGFPGVVAVSPRMVGQGAAEYRDRVEGIEFVGCFPSDEERLMGVQGFMVAGRFSDLEHRKTDAVLGVDLAENLDVRPGSDIRLSVKDREAEVRVSGLIRKETLKDETLVYVSMETAQELMGAGDVVSEIGIGLSDFNSAPAASEKIIEETGYTARSWQESSREIARFLQSQAVINLIFYGLILLITGFVVANTAIMVVRRRTKEIGILMAMGADRRSILRIFLAESLMLGLPAGFIGIMLGIAFAKAVESYPLDVSSGSTTGVTRLLPDLRPEFLGYALVFAVALNLLAWIYPAYVASRLDPVEAIETE